VRLRCAPSLSPVIGLTALLACSTPISFEPQIGDEDEEPDSGVPIDAGARDAGREAGVGDAGRDAATGGRDAATGGRDAATAPPLMVDCDLYPARDCPSEQPRQNTRCVQVPQPGEGSYCYYRAQPEGQVQVAECRTNAPGGPANSATWRVSSARCSYRCGTDLPQGTNFFSLLTSDCATRRLLDCQTAPARTSQEGVDRLLRDFVATCGLPANFRAGVTFNAQGCADWLHYQPGSRLTTAQSLCLSNQLENVRFDCDASCALSPSMAP
jgi:hypothetical protein